MTSWGRCDGLHLFLDCHCVQQFLHSQDEMPTSWQVSELSLHDEGQCCYTLVFNGVKT